MRGSLDRLPGADRSYMEHTYNRETTDRMLRAATDQLGWTREALARSPDGRYATDRLCEVALDIKVLFGADVLTDEEAVAVSDFLQVKYKIQQVGGTQLQAAITASRYKGLFGGEFWSEDEAHNMFIALEEAIREKTDVPKSEYRHRIWGLAEPLFAQRILFGKIHSRTNPVVTEQLVLLSEGSHEGMTTPAWMKGFNHIDWPMDWDEAPNAARVRILGAGAISFTETGIQVLDIHE